MLAPLPLYALLPFVAMLLAIALLPLAWPHWWEPNRNKLLVSAVLGLPVLLLYLVRGPCTPRATTRRSSSCWPAST